jgi:hypothetical protein
MATTQYQLTLQTETSRDQCRCSRQIGRDRTCSNDRGSAVRGRVGKNIFELAQLITAAKIARQIVALDPELRRARYCALQSLESFDRSVEGDQAPSRDVGK